MKRLVSARWWASRWPTAIVYVALCAVFVWTTHRVDELRDDDARVERVAALNNCAHENDRIVALHDFLLAALKDPDPHSYDFITNPALREGALRQAQQRSAAIRGQVTAVFVTRNCAAEIPPPPGG